MSSVIPTDAWPRRSETTLGWTPLSSMSVAWPWRRSWNRTWGRPEGLRNSGHLEDKGSGLSGPRARVGGTDAPAHGLPELLGEDQVQVQHGPCRQAAFGDEQRAVQALEVK